MKRNIIIFYFFLVLCVILTAYFFISSAPQEETSRWTKYKKTINTVQKSFPTDTELKKHALPNRFPSSVSNKKDEIIPDSALIDKISNNLLKRLPASAEIFIKAIEGKRYTLPKGQKDFVVSVKLPNGKQGGFKARVEEKSAKVIITWDNSLDESGTKPHRGHGLRPSGTL